MSNTYYVAGISFSADNALAHHGIKGQRWGVRRYMNEDGTLTPAGRARYGTAENFNRYLENKKKSKEIARANRRQASVDRGRKLLDKNRTRIGAVGRGVGRDVAIGLGAKLGTAAVAAMLTTRVLNERMGSLTPSKTELGALKALSILGVGLSGYNLYRTGRDVVDITRAKNAGYVRKKDRYDDR